MNIKILYANNSLRNYNYVVSCTQTKEAIVIDPLATAEIIAYIEQNHLLVKYIINTHEHWDHVAGNAELKQKWVNTPICCHPNALSSIPCAERGLLPDEVLTLGKNIRINILDTPGHTLAHLCLLIKTKRNTALFSGDTLFNAGCGNCYNGGDVTQLYQTFSKQLFNLPDNTLIYPGHDYIINNLEFTLSREPSNQKAKTLLEELKKTHNPTSPFISTIKLERKVNSFFRLSSSDIKQNLQLSQNTTPDKVFIELRELRNQW